MMLVPIVGIILFAWPPIKFKFFLAFSVAQPVKDHVHCFCSLCLNFSIDYCVGHGIVGVDWVGRLFVPQLFEYDAYVDSLSCHVVKCSEFGFGGR